MNALKTNHPDRFDGCGILLGFFISLLAGMLVMEKIIDIDAKKRNCCKNQ